MFYFVYLCKCTIFFMSFSLIRLVTSMYILLLLKKQGFTFLL